MRTTNACRAPTTEGWPASSERAGGVSSDCARRVKGRVGVDAMARSGPECAPRWSAMTKGSRALGLRTQSVFSLAARREDVGTWRDVHRRDGGLKTCWTKPLPGCSPMGIACRWGSATDTGGVQNGGRHGIGERRNGGGRRRRTRKRGLDPSSHGADGGWRHTSPTAPDLCAREGRGSEDGHHDVSKMRGRSGAPTRRSTTRIWPS